MAVLAAAFIFAWLAPVPSGAAGRLISLQIWSRNQGLGSLVANVLLRDRGHVLWVGTDHGPYRFDGRRFVALDAGELMRQRVNDLYQGTGGRVWIGTSQGLYLWRDGRIRARVKVPVADLRRIAGDGGDGVYVRFERRLVHVDAKGHKRDVPWPQALSPGLVTDGPVMWYRGRLWTTCGARLCTRDVRGKAAWGPSRGVPADHWITMYIDARGGLWVGGDHHLMHLAADGNRFSAVASNDPVEALASDARGRILAGTAGHISRWDGKRWQAFDDRRSLQSAQIRDLLFDPDGQVWVATGGRGVLRWRGYAQFENWQHAQGLDSVPTWAIARDADGRLWLGNQRHGNLLGPGADRLAPWPTAMRRKGWTNVTALLAHARSMWVLFTAGSLVRYDLDSHRAQTVMPHVLWSKFALIDRRERMWIGSKGTLWRIDDLDAASPVARKMDTGLPDDTNYLGACRGRDGTLWFATSRGLLRYARGRFTRMRLPAAMPAGGLVGVGVDAQGRLWMAPVAHGLWRGRPGDAGSLAATPVRDALVRASRYYSLAIDSAGRVWAGSDAGVDVHADGRWRRLDQGDGLAWDDMAAGAFHEDADGSIWLGTSGGVSHVLDPGRLLPAPRLDRPVILEVRYGTSRIATSGAVSLPWSGKSLGVMLASIEDVHANDARIEYRLLDSDHHAAGWETSGSRRLRYAALEPGSYRFEARVFDRALREYSPATAFSFTIAPPWWRTRWARIAYALAGMMVLWLLWRWRNAGLLRRQVQLEGLVAERTRQLEDEKRGLEAAHRAKTYEASHDALTGLLNRGAVVKQLMLRLAGAIDLEHALGVVLIDLDNFKRVNDTYGHLAGDAVLVQCARRLREQVPEGVELGRFGGEELMAVWPGLGDEADLQRRLAPIVEGRYHDHDRSLDVTCSIGVARARPDDDVDSLLRRADAALYRAKHEGRARIVFTD